MSWRGRMNLVAQRVDRICIMYCRNPNLKMIFSPIIVIMFWNDREEQYTLYLLFIGCFCFQFPSCYTKHELVYFLPIDFILNLTFKSRSIGSLVSLSSYEPLPWCLNRFSVLFNTLIDVARMQASLMKGWDNSCYRGECSDIYLKSFQHIFLINFCQNCLWLKLIFLVCAFLFLHKDVSFSFITCFFF